MLSVFPIIPTVQKDLSLHLARPFAYFISLFSLCLPQSLKPSPLCCRCLFLIIIYLKYLFLPIHEKVTTFPFQVTSPKWPSLV